MEKNAGKLPDPCETHDLGGKQMLSVNHTEQVKLNSEKCCWELGGQDRLQTVMTGIVWAEAGQSIQDRGDSLCKGPEARQAWCIPGARLEGCECMSRVSPWNDYSEKY